MAYTFTHRGIKYTIPDSLLSDTGGSWSGTDSKVYNVINMVKYYIDHGKEPDDATMKSLEYERDYGKYEGNWNDGVDTSGRVGSFRKIVSWMASDSGKEQIKLDNEGIFLDENGLPRFGKDKKPLSEEEFENNVSEKYNPYIEWLKQNQQASEKAELGLLNEQTRASVQNAEISSQQAMIQQAQFKDQIVEQIKLDRMAKMRQGISPMQIANENLQFLVGNMQANNQQVGAVNQARLAATQQQAMNPYQAYLNSINGPGYQANANVATGMAATDASDMYQQAMKYAKSQGRNYIIPDDYKMVQGLKDQ